MQFRCKCDEIHENLLFLLTDCTALATLSAATNPTAPIVVETIPLSATARRAANAEPTVTVPMMTNELAITAPVYTAAANTVGAVAIN